MVYRRSPKPHSGVRFPHPPFYVPRIPYSRRSGKPTEIESGDLSARIFLERLYKSKIARALTLAGTLSGAAAAYKGLYSEGQIRRSEYAHSLGKTDEIRLGRLGKI